MLLTTKTEWAYLRVRELILRGEMRPGSVIDQQTLAASLGVSTTPLREALRHLEAEGFVQGEHHREMRVAAISLKNLEQTYAVRIELDAYAAAEACRLASDEHIQCVDRLLKGADWDDPVEALKANRMFHRAIYSSTDNVVLTGILDSLWDQCDRYRILLIQSEPSATAARHDHGRLLTLLRRRDGVALSNAMRRHLSDSLNQLRQQLQGRPNSDAGT